MINEVTFKEARSLLNHAIGAIDTMNNLTKLRKLDNSIKDIECAAQTLRGYRNLYRAVTFD